MYLEQRREGGKEEGTEGGREGGRENADDKVRYVIGPKPISDILALVGKSAFFNLYTLDILTDWTILC